MYQVCIYERMTICELNENSPAVNPIYYCALCILYI